MANLLKTAVSVLASTVKLTVSFMEPLVTVSVMLRCSQQAASSCDLDVADSFCESEEGADTPVSSHPSQSEWHEKSGKKSLNLFPITTIKGSLHANAVINVYSRNVTFMLH